MITNLHYRQMCSGLSVSELATRTNIPRTQLYSYLSGMTFPRDTRLTKLARVLECQADDLTGWCADETLAV